MSKDDPILQPIDPAHELRQEERLRGLEQNVESVDARLVEAERRIKELIHRSYTVDRSMIEADVLEILREQLRPGGLLNPKVKRKEKPSA